jgi:hypothetical protein
MTTLTAAPAIVNGSVEDLTAQLIAAAKRFDEYANEPDQLYVQLSHDIGWTAEFSDSHSYDSVMTRWSTGEDISKLYIDILANNGAAIVAYADSIMHGWDASWTDF